MSPYPYPKPVPIVAGLAWLALAACAGSVQAPPQAGESMGGVPDLEGRKVMVFPVQRSRGLDAALDASSELSFALESRGGAEWVLPAEIRRAVDRSPGLQLSAEGLPVDMFLRAQVERVGDPLFGYLRRMAAVTAADLALLPVEARGAVADQDGESRVEIRATLLNARTGRVYWYGVVEGTSAGSSAGALAGAAEALARAVTPRLDSVREAVR